MRWRCAARWTCRPRSCCCAPSASTAAVEVPLADLVWRLHLPSGYEVVSAGGTVATDEIERPMPAAVQVAGVLYYLTGGLSGPPAMPDMSCAPRRAYKSAPSAAMPTERVTELSRSPAAATDIAPRPLGRNIEADRKIQEALKSPTRMEFIETPLSDVIDYLKSYHHIDIQLDNRALTDVGIGTDTPVTKNLKDVSLRSALRLMLRELGLTYVIQDEVLMITTPEEAESRLTTVFYPVADLVTFRDKSGERWSDFDSLIEMITSTVKPTTWDAVGGPGSICPIELANKTEGIALSQTQEVHEEIAEFLAQLRTLHPTQADGQPPLKEQSKMMGGMGGSMGGMGGGFGGMGGGMAHGGKGGMGGMAGGMGGTFGGTPDDVTEGIRGHRGTTDRARRKTGARGQAEIAAKIARHARRIAEIRTQAQAAFQTGREARRR